MSRHLPKIKFNKIFINNEWRNSVTGKVFSTINPATGEKICDVQQGTKADIDIAVIAAREAFKRTSPWRTMDASNRGKLMFTLADLMEQNFDELVHLETLDNGKPLSASKGDIQEAIRVIRYYAGFTDKIHGKTIPINGNFFAYTREEPIGVVGQIIPWNFPLLMVSWKIGPGLCTGNTIILKPAEQTPLTALYIAHLVKEAGFPPGVFNVIPGYGDPGQALVEHDDVDKIAFTGSTEVGKLVQREAGNSTTKRVTLELGGKSPIVVLEDADLDLAAKIAHEGVFINQGQCCCAATRTYVQEDVYEKFVEKSRELAAKRVVGDPFDEKTVQGPQIDERQYRKILNYIEIGKREGAKLEYGGESVGDRGYFIKPTVFSEVDDAMTIATEEIFGPVQQIIRFKTLDEVIERSNNTRYGLASSIITNNMDKANTYVQAVQAGNVWVNSFMPLAPQVPFGGFKMSGQGRELGEDGLKEYLEIKSVVTTVPVKNS